MRERGREGARGSEREGGRQAECVREGRRVWRGEGKGKEWERRNRVRGRERERYGSKGQA